MFLRFLTPLSLLVATSAWGQTSTFVVLDGGRLRVFPTEQIVRQDTLDGQVRFHLAVPEVGQPVVKSYALAEVRSISTTLPAGFHLPKFASWKVNNKYNPNVHVDAIGTLNADSTQVAVTIGAIDRTVIPSFQLTEQCDAAGVRVYVDTVRQESKVSLVRFDGPVRYTLAYPDHVQYQWVQTQAAQAGQAGEMREERTPIALAAEQITCNYPSVNATDAIAHLLDGNTATYFHSYWGDGLDQSVIPYLEIDLRQQLKAFAFAYTTRTSSTNNMPSAIEVMVSADGRQWTSLRTLTAADGLPQEGAGQTYQSPTLTSPTGFRYVRLVCAQSTRKNYLVLAELSLQTVVTTQQPATPATPARYQLVARPYGQQVEVVATFPAQQATAVPRIDITLLDGVELADIHAFKDKYRKAKIRIDGAGIWPNLEENVEMKGRGNSTWAMAKKPYRLTFSKGQKPFGLTKGKSWVLLANALGKGAAHLTNAIAMKTAQLVGTAAANHIIPVELYVNEKYVGAYNFTEQIGISGNSVNLPSDSTGVLLELDTYEDDDPYFWASNGIRTKYKDPDPEDYVEDFGKEAQQLFAQTTEDEFNHFVEATENGTAAQLLDVPALCRYFLVNDLVGNLEFGHPKSTYVHRSDVFDPASKWTFGPVWDCDWAYGYEQSQNFAVVSPEFDALTKAPKHAGRTFFEQLMSLPEVKQEYYATWHRFIHNGGLEALTRFVDDYYAFVAPAIQNDLQAWGHVQDYTQIAPRMRDWVKRRAEYIFAQLEAFPIVSGLAPLLDSRGEGEDESEARHQRSAGHQALHRGVFTLSGTQVDLPAHRLPAGLYIVDGEKRVVR